MPVKLDVLTPGELDRIHRSALQVLAGTGVGMDLPAAWEILGAAGARVDREFGRVRLPEELVSEAVSAAPGSFTLYGRDPGCDVRVPDGIPHFGPWSNSVRVLDPETGVRRPATSRDLELFLRLVEALPNFTWAQPLLSPQDVPKDKAYFHSWALAFRNTRKHLIGTAQGAEGVRVVLEMAAAVAGGRQRLSERPFVTFHALARPPLSWNRWSLGVLLEAAANRIPVYLAAGPITGATGPATLAGTLVQAHAELLAGITLSQLANPGTPVLYSSSCRIMDMRTGGVSLCSPEWFLYRVCLRQLGRYVGLPVITGGLFTDSKIPDAQDGFEKGVTGLAGALGGDLIAGCTLEDNKCADLGDLVIGDEIAGYIKRIAKGFTVDDETLAVDQIAGVGPGGEFLSLPHTRRNFRREIWQPGLADRSSRGDWEARGGQDHWQRARRRACEILAGRVARETAAGDEFYQLDDERWAELERIVALAPGISAE